MELESRTRRDHRTPSLSCVWAYALGLAACSALAVALPARADWSDDFDGGFGAAWHFAATDDAGNPPSTGTATFAVVDAGADDYLLIAHSTKALRDGGGGATDGFGWVDETFTNLAISADVNAGPSQGQQSVLGVIGRGDPVVGSAYLAAVDFASSRFMIARSDDLIDFQTPLVVDSSVALDRAKTYRIEFFLVGSSLSARLLDASTRAQLSTISVNDASYASGGAGIIVETAYDLTLTPVAPIVGTFDSVEAVPEPGLAALLAGGTALLSAFHAAPRLARSGEGRSRRVDERPGRPAGPPPPRKHAA